MANNELYHYGTLGQKWGRRRYQYEDGSLTPEGREHYGVGDPRLGISKEDLNKYYNKLTFDSAVPTLFEKKRYMYWINQKGHDENFKRRQEFNDRLLSRREVRETAQEYSEMYRDRVDKYHNAISKLMKGYDEFDDMPDELLEKYHALEEKYEPSSKEKEIFSKLDRQITKYMDSHAGELLYTQLAYHPSDDKNGEFVQQVRAGELAVNLALSDFRSLAYRASRK